MLPRLSNDKRGTFFVFIASWYRGLGISQIFKLRASFVCINSFSCMKETFLFKLQIFNEKKSYICKL